MTASPLKMLLTGANGMLGREIQRKFGSKYAIYGVGTRPNSIHRAFPYFQFDLKKSDFTPLKNFCNPDIIINCAADTDHESCEANIEDAFKINSFAPVKLRQTFPNASLIHISSDAVFGREQIFPDESVIPDPFGVYGISKRLGEKLLINDGSNHLILRTTIVGLCEQRRRPALADWIINSLDSGRSINLFCDALFSPVSVDDFCKVIEQCINKNLTGVYNCAGGENISKYDFGVKLAQKLGLDTSLIQKGSLKNTDLWKTRRCDQTLDSRLLEKTLNFKLYDSDHCVESIKERAHERRDN